MRGYARFVLEYIGIMTLVIFIWRLLEKIVLGEINPSSVDSNELIDRVDKVRV